MKMSEGERPTPVPRPRQATKSVDETDRSSKVYENYVLPTLSTSKSESVYDSLNAQLSELKVDAVHRPVPSPRARTAPATAYENAPETAKPLNNQQKLITITTEVPKSTGAIRKAPNIPSKIPSVKNNLEISEPVSDKVHDDRSQKDFDVLSQTSSTSAKSGGDSKFATPSPGLDFFCEASP